MAETFKMTIAGVERELTKYPVSDKLDIAAFILFDDVEITEKSAQELLKVCPEHDIVLTAEAKSIPLCYEFARIGCRRYVVARKGTKVYMSNPLSVCVNSITTDYDQKLHLGQEDVEKLKGKRVLILDDVISTGESLTALEELAQKAGANVVGKAAVLAEGDAADRDDIIFLEKLPLFFK
ncbi:MAG: adenine phosphoribosyltransferase [Ruminococcus sp.]|nr:adenine phosphoribosyltransferase [Ruminococcus sp.]